jgi:protein-tyrosine-phosphatase
MAEALANHFLGDRYQAFSAGTEATRVNPLAIRVLNELGIDTSRQYSKTIEEYAGQTFDHVVTLCGDETKNARSFSGEWSAPTMALKIRHGLAVEKKMSCQSFAGCEMKSKTGSLIILEAHNE